MTYTVVLDSYNKNKVITCHKRLGGYRMFNSNGINNNEDSDTLKKSLRRCHQAANEGIGVSIQQVQNIKSIMDSVVEFNKQVHFSYGITKVPQEYIKYKEGLKNVQNQLDATYISMTNMLDQYKDKLSHFTITVYGKTMAGKSTLMEVLKEGNGSSIGKGAQRTTRDVREYIWKETGVKFVDVPGIGAAIAGGDKDERIAFEAAKCADLILFLITDDGPQKEEAQAFAKVKKLGKPMVCILNVKASGISKSISPKLRIRNVTKRMAETADFENIRKQFYQYAIEFGQDWRDVPFLYVDLHSAWLSQQEKDTEMKKLLYNLSRIKLLKQAIASKINQRGAFYQFKTPIDIVHHGLLKTSENVFKQYVGSSHLLETLTCQMAELKKITSAYNQNSLAILGHTCNHMRKVLDDTARRFADEHFADNNAEENWKKTVESLQLDKQMKDTLVELQENRNRVLKRFSSQVSARINISFHLSQVGIQGDDPVDTKFLADLASTAISIGTLFTGWGLLAKGAVSVGSLLLGNVLTDSKKEKIKKRQDEMYLCLSTWIAGPKKKTGGGRRPDCFMTELENTLMRIYQEIYQSFQKTQEDLNGYLKNIRDMNSTQLSIWKQMNSTLKSMNIIVMQRAFQYLPDGEGVKSLLGIARIPGQATLLSLPTGYRISPDCMRKLNIMMQEPIYVFNTPYLSAGQAIKNIGNLSDTEIAIFEDNTIKLIKVKNKAAEKIDELRKRREFVPEDLKMKAQTVEVLCRLVAQLYDYPIISYIDNA